MLTQAGCHSSAESRAPSRVDWRFALPQASLLENEGYRKVSVPLLYSLYEGACRSCLLKAFTTAEFL